MNPFEELIARLLYESETEALDFKKDQYRFVRASDDEKSELLKDLLAFANSWRRTDAYILVGVEESKGGGHRPVGISRHLDDAQLQQFVSSKTQRRLEFTYHTVDFKGAKLGLFHIPLQNRPAYLVTDYGKLAAKTVYVRRGSSTAIAPPDEIAEMGAARVTHTARSPRIELGIAKRQIANEATTQHHLTVRQLRTSEVISDLDHPRTSWGDPHERVNLDYYRELFEFVKRSEAAVGFYFLVSNTGEAVAHDVRAVFRTPHTSGLLLKDQRWQPDRPRRLLTIADSVQMPDLAQRDVEVRPSEDDLLVEVTFGKLQPKDQLWTADRLFVGSLDSGTFKLSGTIFADELHEPSEVTLEFQIDLLQATVDLDAIHDIYSQQMLRDPAS